MRTKPDFLSRREFLKLAAGTTIGLYTGCAALPKKASLDGHLFSFGAIADIQYADCPPRGRRIYRDSLRKVRECVKEFNSHDLSFVIQLGDFVDRDFESFDTILPIYNKLKATKYHVLGNHDFPCLPRSVIYEKLSLEKPYYDFARDGWRFIILDSNDVSVYANEKDSPKYRKADTIYQNFKKQNAVNAYPWNAAMGQEQIDWLKKKLDRATSENEKVVLFAHMPLLPLTNHTLWNADEIIKIIESYDCVVAYMNGHYHPGNYVERQGAHHLNLKGMVEAEENAYAIVSVYPDHLQVDGFGAEPDRILKFNQGKSQCRTAK